MIDAFGVEYAKLQHTLCSRVLEAAPIASAPNMLVFLLLRLLLFNSEKPHEPITSRLGC